MFFLSSFLLKSFREWKTKSLKWKKGEKKLDSELNLPQLEGFAYYFKDDKIKLPLPSEDILNVFNDLGS